MSPRTTAGSLRCRCQRAARSAERCTCFVPIPASEWMIRRSRASTTQPPAVSSDGRPTLRAFLHALSAMNERPDAEPAFYQCIYAFYQRIYYYEASGLTLGFERRLTGVAGRGPQLRNYPQPRFFGYRAEHCGGGQRGDLALRQRFRSILPSSAPSKATAGLSSARTCSPAGLSRCVPNGRA